MLVGTFQLIYNMLSRKLLRHYRRWQLGVNRPSVIIIGCYLGTIVIKEACYLKSIKLFLYIQVEGYISDSRSRRALLLMEFLPISNQCCCCGGGDGGGGGLL